MKVPQMKVLAEATLRGGHCYPKLKSDHLHGHSILHPKQYS